MMIKPAFQGNASVIASGWLLSSVRWRLRLSIIPSLLVIASHWPLGVIRVFNPLSNSWDVP